MRVFKNPWFEKFARKQDIGDDALREAIGRAERGLIDADLGGGVIKQRVAREGQGKSGSFRTVILFRTGLRAILSATDLKTFKRAAKVALGLGDAAIGAETEAGRLKEVNCDEGL